MRTTGRRKKASLYAGVAGVVLLAAALFLVLGPPEILATTARPDFCAQCHVMESNYEAWIHAGAHRRARCVDCHLPNRNPGLHYLWKTLHGAKDAVLFYSGRVPARIVLSAHGEGVLKENCVRCHETAVEVIDTERKCWSCHRRISHRRSGAIETL